MIEGLKLLVRLQKLDGSIQDIEATTRRLAREGAEAERRAEEAQQKSEYATNEMTSFRAAMDRRDGDLKELEARINKLSIQLNIIKTNREYAAIQHEIMGAKADKSRIEDEILTMMDQMESQQREIQELAARKAEAAEEVKRRKQVIKEAIQDAEARILRLKEERNALCERIPTDLRQPYERLHKGTAGRALSACRNFVCERCRMSLTANTVNLLMAGNNLIYCQSCGRILYLPEGEDMQGGKDAGRR